MADLLLIILDSFGNFFVPFLDNQGLNFRQPVFNELDLQFGVIFIIKRGCQCNLFQGYLNGVKTVARQGFLGGGYDCPANE